MHKFHSSMEINGNQKHIAGGHLFIRQQSDKYFIRNETEHIKTHNVEWNLH